MDDRIIISMKITTFNFQFSTFNFQLSILYQEKDIKNQI